MLMQFRSEGTTFLFDAVLEETVLDKETVGKDRGVRLDNGYIVEIVVRRSRVESSVPIAPSASSQGVSRHSH